MRLAILVTALVAAACTAPARPVDVPDVLVVGTTEAPGDLDPALCYDATCAYAVLPNTHAGLTTIGEDLEPAAGIARSWTVSDDGSRYTFTLSGGVRLHDGTLVDAEVVAASLRRAARLAPEGAPGTFFGDDGVLAIEGRDRSVTMTLARPDATLPARLAFAASSIVSPAVYPDASAAPRDVMSGAGPYTLEGEPTEDAFELTAVADGPPERTVRFRTFATAAALRSALEAGTVHVAWRTWNPDEIDALTRSADVSLVSAPGPATRFLGFNVTVAPFDDVNVRRAIASGVDRDALAGVQAGAGEPLYGLVPAAFGVRTDGFGSFDDDDVDEHLAAAGYGPGEVLDVDLWHTPTHYGDGETDAAEALATALGSTGRFQVSVRTAEWPDYQGSLVRGRMGMFLLGWFPDHLDPDAYLYPFLHSSTTSSIGSGYASDAMDDLLESQRAAVGGERRRPLLVAIEELVASDVPYVPLWTPHTVVAHHRSVRGVRLEPAPYLRLSSVQRAG